jgi:hypothetical protein
MDISNVFRGWCLLPLIALKFLNKLRYISCAGTFGYDMAIQDRSARMPSKLQVKFVSNFQISMSFLPIYLLLNGNINFCLSFSFIFYRCLVGKLWQKSPKVAKTCHSGVESNLQLFRV